MTISRSSYRWQYVNCLILLFQLVQCLGSDSGSRRPPPPPPPPPRSARPGDLQYEQQQQRRYTAPNDGEPIDWSSREDQPETSPWYPANPSQEFYQQEDAYGMSTGGDAGGDQNVLNYDASAQQDNSKVGQDLYRYEDERSNRPQTEDYFERDDTNAENRPLRTDPPRMPIHYEFPAARGSEDNIDTKLKGDRRRFEMDNEEAKSLPASASARKDLVTRYWSTKSGKAQIMGSATLIGAGIGNFLGKSLIGSHKIWITIVSLLFLISTWFRTPMGELSRAMGLSLLLVLQRSRSIRKTYPTYRYVAASLGLRNSRDIPPFPPARNPWRYKPRSPRDPSFNMTHVMLSMIFLGGAVGASLPIPTWIGALAGAGSFALACTSQSVRGDLARTCGMRVAAAVGELWEIQADLQIIPKATVVSSQVIDKAMILDRKHRVKDRFLSLANKGYEQASKIASQIHQQQRGGMDDRTDDDEARRNKMRRGDRRPDASVGDTRQENTDRQQRRNEVYRDRFGRPSSREESRSGRSDRPTTGRNRDYYREYDYD